MVLKFWRHDKNIGLIEKTLLSSFSLKNIYFSKYDKIEKKKPHLSKNQIGIYDVDIDKKIISDASAFGKNKKPDAKFFIGYKDGEKLV